VAEAIMKNIADRDKGVISLEETYQYWENFRKKYNIKSDKDGKSIVQWLREDRDSH
jgi:hypothetical protein